MANSAWFAPLRSRGMAQPQRNISRKFTTQTGPCQPPGSKELNHGHTQARTLVARYLLRRRLLKKSDLLGCWLACAFLAALITTAEAIYATLKLGRITATPLDRVID